MTKKRKENLLYKMAKGQPCDASPAELRELKKYKVTADWDCNVATHSTISKYISAVDNGCRLSFYDWCANNLQGDRRKANGKTEYILAKNKAESMGAVCIGWLLSGIAVYWILKKQVSVPTCAIIGAMIAYVLQKRFRKMIVFTLVLLPCILSVLFASVIYKLV